MLQLLEVYLNFLNILIVLIHLISTLNSSECECECGRSAVKPASLYPHFLSADVANMDGPPPSPNKSVKRN